MKQPLMGNNAESIYSSGEYLANNPTWGVEDSTWKADQVVSLVQEHQLKPKSIVDVGCGAGVVLAQVHKAIESSKECYGFDISPQAISLASQRTEDGLSFSVGDFLVDTEFDSDLILCLDVIEHLENPFAFLRELRNRSQYAIFHIPLEISALHAVFNKSLYNAYELSGHLHFFTREIALSVLEKSGYKIIEDRYTPGALDLPRKTALAKLANVPRRLFSFIAGDGLCSRVFGGFSLIVLAER